MDELLTGSCQCGAVTLDLPRAVVLTLYRCHCRECQKQAASAFALSLKVARVDVRMRGTLATFSRPTDSGRESVANFCVRCGCRVYHGGADAEILSVKAGLLDQIGSLEPIGNIWTDSALPWIDTSSGLSFARQPPSYEPLIAAWAAQEGSLR